MVVSRSSSRRLRAARAAIGVVLAGLLTVGGALALAPDADAANSVRANSVKITPAVKSL